MHLTLTVFTQVAISYVNVSFEQEEISDTSIHRDSNCSTTPFEHD